MSSELWETPHGVKMRFPTEAKPYYRLEYTLGGRRRQPSVGKDRDLAWAEALRVDKLMAVDNGDLSELSVTDLAEAWFSDGSTYWARTYIDCNRRNLDLFVLPAIGHIAVGDLGRQHVREAINCGSTESVRAQLRSAMSSLLTYGIQQDWVTKSRDSLMPPASASQKAAKRQPTEFVPPDEIPETADVLALAAAIAAPREPKHPKGRLYTPPEYLTYAVLVAGFCGLRIGEMLALQGGDVKNGLLRVQRQTQWLTGEGSVTLPPKTGKSREVVIADKVGEYELRKWMEARAKEVGPNGLMFPASRGGQQTAANFTKYFMDHARQEAWAGKDWTYHSLRHHFATWLLSLNLPAKDVSVMCGHSSVKLTLDRYVNANASTYDRVRQAVNQAS